LDVRALDALGLDLRAADERVSALRVGSEEQESALKIARGEMETIRGAVAELDVLRATVESDLAHLAASCVDTVQASLDDVVAEVAQLEQEGVLTPDARV